MNKILNIKRTILGMLAMAGLAYTAMLAAMVGFDEVDAGQRELISSICHSRDSDPNVDNAADLTYTGSGLKAIYCPFIRDSITPLSSGVDVDVYGKEVTDGANSRTCQCDHLSMSCGCSPHTNWVNNSGGNPGLVAPNLHAGAWATGSQKWAYIHHNLSHNSVLNGMIITTP